MKRRLLLPASPCLRVPVSLFVLLFLPTLASATWFDPAWKFRRQIDVLWDSDKAQGGELAMAEFYTGGHSKPNGEDIRVATDEGRPVATHVLMAGPGDRAKVVFALSRRVSRYYVYFGNEIPPPARPDLADVKYQCGLLLDMKHLPGGGRMDASPELQQAWEKSEKPIGQTMILEPFLGINPLGPEDQYVSRISGSLKVEADGDYTFAAAVHSRALLLIDGKKVLFASDGPSDVRFNGKVSLTKGPHDFVLYHADLAGDGRVVVAWIVPGKSTYEKIPAMAFGLVAQGVTGSLEEIRKDLTADFSIEYAGECFFANHFSHRYKFSARGPLKNARLQLRWDFGDGQTSTAADVEHVYLTDGIYPITLAMQIGASGDSLTSKLAVSRRWERIDNPPTDEVPKHSSIVQTYDVSRMPDDWLPWGTMLHQRAEKLEAALVVAARLASIPHHADAWLAFAALDDAAKLAEKDGKPSDMAGVLEKTPLDSDLQPKVAMELAGLLMWQVGNFGNAVQSLAPYAAKGDDELKRAYGQALVLAGRVEEGRKVLGSVPAKGDRKRQAALSGAQARTIEFYLTQKEADAGEVAWQRWQALYPDDFLQGYSVVLQTRLMELQNVALAAARLAEAFANAVPGSSYAPQLLDRASKLFAGTDPAKSSAIRKLLKERYPEDPLSQQ